MADRPIIFSVPMVRALLEGRKTQTRRLMKLPDRSAYGGQWETGTVGGGGAVDGQGRPFPPHVCFWHSATGEVGVPRWKVGDRLWVREGWKPLGAGTVWYRADGERAGEAGQWRPSIHMPRWASRLTLQVTEVRLEHLQAISDDDCLAEGCIRLPASGRITDVPGGQYAGRLWGSPSAWYRELWDTLHGEGSWAANPRVVAITFEVISANIDTLTHEAAA